MDLCIHLRNDPQMCTSHLSLTYFNPLLLSFRSHISVLLGNRLGRKGEKAKPETEKVSPLLFSHHGRHGCNPALIVEEMVIVIMFHTNKFKFELPI